MIIVTTPSIEQNEISTYCGIVSAEVIQGVNFIDDFKAAMRDGFGGRSATYERHFREARRIVTDELEKQAKLQGANAIVGVKYDYEILGGNNGMLMVAASGTAVIIEKNAAAKLAEQIAADENAPAHLVRFNGSEKGPFSTVQVRELVARGVITRDAEVSSETFPEARCVADLVGAE